MTPSTDLYQSLTAHLLRIGPAAIAFSGGLDSRFLAFMAQKAGIPLLLMHVRGPHVAGDETLRATRWARQQGLDLVPLKTNVLEHGQISRNGRQRCYHCKHHIFSLMRQTLEDIHTAGGLRYTLCDGTNAGDLTRFRPGLRALRELGVLSPLALCNIGKQNIHDAGALLGFDNSFQPAKSCLLTRFPYDVTPTSQQLKDLERAETVIEDVLASLPVASNTRSIEFRLRYVHSSTPDIRYDVPSASGAASGPLPRPGTKLSPEEKFSTLKAELHITAALSEKITGRITLLLGREGFSLDSIVPMRDLSGYFDKA